MIIETTCRLTGKFKLMEGKFSSYTKKLDDMCTGMVRDMRITLADYSKGSFSTSLKFTRIAST